jgi:carboxyl-terminal processing protease
MAHSSLRLQRSPIVLIGSAIATTLFTTLLPMTPAHGEFEDSPKVVLDEAWQIVDREYVDDTFNQVDWDAARQRLLGQEYSSREAAYRALEQELRRLNDPYTRFLDPQQYSELTDQTAGEVSGVGLQLHRDPDSRDIIVTEVTVDSPAARSGLRAGDRIVLVDGQSTARLSVSGVAQLLKGAENSQVTLTFARGDGQPRTVILTRARIDLPTVDFALRETSNHRIGYIRLVEFNAHATEEMTAAINSLTAAGVDGFVLDLRSNPGGLLSASIEISRLWLQRGPIVLTQDRSGESEQISANRTSLTDLPLAVLVNNRSASSSEIVTGALQDNDRALVVGTTTYGKALVQSLYGLTDGSGLAVTIAHYYTPDGTDISQRGITPDVNVPISRRDLQTLTNDPRLLATTSDAQWLQAVTALEPVIIAYQHTTPSTPSQLGRFPEEEDLN